MKHAALWLISWPVSAVCVVALVASRGRWTWPLRVGLWASAWRRPEGEQ